ncbi:MAG: hypothetical protein GX903_09240 [Spirochaetales bacterium]|nr:hypothetical protein [Spirochaetales bacterium]
MVKKVLLLLAIVPSLLFATISPTLDFNFSLNMIDEVLTPILKMGVGVSGNTNEVKGVFKANISATTNTVTPSLNLAYIRFKMPFFNDTFARFTIGKSNVVLGFGSVLSAADLVNGNNAEKRGELTVYNVNIYLPFSENFSLTPIIIYPELDNTKLKYGGKIAYTSSSFLKETQLLFLGNNKVQELALAFDGNLYFDFSLEAKLKFQALKDYSLSLGLSKLWQVSSQTISIPLSFKIEALYEGLTNSVTLYSNATIGLFDSFGLGLTLLTDFNQYKALVNFNYTLTNKILFTLNLGALIKEAPQFLGTMYISYTF